MDEAGPKWIAPRYHNRQELVIGRRGSERALVVISLLQKSYF